MCPESYFIYFTHSRKRMKAGLLDVQASQAQIIQPPKICLHVFSTVCPASISDILTFTIRSKLRKPMSNVISCLNRICTIKCESDLKSKDKRFLSETISMCAGYWDQHENCIFAPSLIVHPLLDSLICLLPRNIISKTNCLKQMNIPNPSFRELGISNSQCWGSGVSQQRELGIGNKAIPPPNAGVWD